jgi:hemolysin III
MGGPCFRRGVDAHLSVSPSSIRPAWGLRHPASGLLHLVGALGTVGAAIWSAFYASQPLAPLVFSVSMFMLYAASSAYHLVRGPDRLMRKLRLLDHSMIYVFIAGSYTPFCLKVDPEIGIPFLIATWSLAAVGVFLKLFSAYSSRLFRVGVYLGMAWLGVFLVPAMKASLSPISFQWFLAGAAIYTAGSFVYALKRPDPWPEHFGYHEIWHLFVLCGSYCHLRAVIYLQ